MWIFFQLISLYKPVYIICIRYIICKETWELNNMFFNSCRVIFCLFLISYKAHPCQSIQSRLPCMPSSGIRSDSYCLLELLSQDFPLCYCQYFKQFLFFIYFVSSLKLCRIWWNEKIWWSSDFIVNNVLVFMVDFH